MIDKVKQKNAAVFQHEADTKGAKAAAEKALVDASRKADHAKAVAAQALKDYDKKLHETQAIADKNVAAMQVKVKEAKDALTHEEDELADAIKTRDETLEQAISPWIKKKNLTHNIAMKLAAQSEDAEDAKVKAAARWKAAAEKLKDFHIEVKKWQETLV